MPHARYHEKPHRLLHRLRSCFRNDSFVVVDRDFRRNARITPSVDEQQLPPAREKLSQIGINRVDWCDIRFICERDIAIEIDRTLFVIPFGILEYEVFEELDWNTERLGS